MSTLQDFRSILEMFEQIVEKNPLIFEGRPHMLKFLANKAINLNQKVNIPMQD